MEHNIPLMRKIYEQITQHPETHDQGHWCTCVAGWAIRLHGEYGFLNGDNPLNGGVQAFNFRTGEIRWTDDLAGELLGMQKEEAAGLFGVTDRMAVDWIADILVADDMRQIRLLTTGFDDNDYPIGQVQG